MMGMMDEASWDTDCGLPAGLLTGFRPTAVGVQQEPEVRDRATLVVVMAKTRGPG